MKKKLIVESGLSPQHESKIKRVSSEAARSYYVHETVRHSWSVQDLEKAIRRSEYQKRGGLGLAPSLADAGRRGKALGCSHNTLQNSLRTSSRKSR